MFARGGSHLDPKAIAEWHGIGLLLLVWLESSCKEGGAENH